MTHLHSLQQWLKTNKIDAFILPTRDRFLNEFVPESEQRLKWLTGFTGSNGIALILQDEAILFTDGRYTLQARQELNMETWKVIDLGDFLPCSWLNAHVQKTCKLAYDPWIHPIFSILNYGAKRVELLPLEANPIDTFWKDKPPLAYHPIEIHSLDYAGLSKDDKLKQLARKLKEKSVDILLISKPESICWLLNIRSRDVPHTPLALSYALFDQSGELFWFTDAAISDDVKAHLGDNVAVHPLHDMAAIMKEMVSEHITISAPYADTPAWFYHHAELKDITCPVMSMKAQKNDTEQKGMVDGHIQDGIALTQAWHWLEQNLDKEKITELSFSKKLIEFRTKQPDFVMPSFTTIAGYAENGAIIHYHPTEATNKIITSGNLLLVDSGGQYRQATTDVTRVFALGDNATDEQKHHYTLVLKGHIALANAVFPAGTSGQQLDVLARQYLWEEGLDFNHGTGHGVGSFLAVHEGPQTISKKASSTPLVPGMVVSNEPGYYQEGSYGIRIESLIMVTKHPTIPSYYTFKTLTCVPLDPRLIKLDMLSKTEKNWLKEYNRWVRKTLKPYIEDEAWLITMTTPY